VKEEVRAYPLCTKDGSEIKHTSQKKVVLSKKLDNLHGK
jgi:hypothetical protein